MPTFSVAGKRAGEDDDRHLWPEMLRVIKESRPSWVIAENVTGHINMGLDQVLSDLETEGYDSGTFVIPACSLNAHHRRDRLWIIGYSDSARRGEGNKEMENQTSEQPYSLCIQSEQINSDPSGIKLQRFAEESFPRVSDLQSKLERSGETIRIMPNSLESGVLGITNGFPGRVDRIKRLGNAVVPQIPEAIGRAIMEIENGA